MIQNVLNYDTYSEPQEFKRFQKMMVMRVRGRNKSKDILYVENNNRLRTKDLQFFQSCILPVNGFLLFSIRSHSELFMHSHHSNLLPSQGKYLVTQ